MVNKFYSALDWCLSHNYNIHPPRWIYTSRTLSLRPPLLTPFDLHSLLLRNHCRQQPWFCGHHRCLIQHPLRQAHFPPLTSSSESEPLGDVEEEVKVVERISRQPPLDPVGNACVHGNNIVASSESDDGEVTAREFFVFCSGAWMWYIKLPFLFCVSSL